VPEPCSARGLKEVPPAVSDRSPLVKEKPGAVSRIASRVYPTCAPIKNRSRAGSGSARNLRFSISRITDLRSCVKHAAIQTRTLRRIELAAIHHADADMARRGLPRLTKFL